MRLPLYLSSGAFTGRINGRNPRLLFDAAKVFPVAGFELMIFDELYSPAPTLFPAYRAAGIPIPLIHADKKIGDFMSLPDGEEAALSLFGENMKLARLAGAKGLVTHCWGMPPSDRYTDLIYRRVGLLKEAAEREGLLFLVENCVCSDHSPLFHMKNLRALYPDISFTVDTRCSEFHGELPETLREEALWRDNVRHVHINDYKGAVRDWSARYPIPRPPMGQIDWPGFFAALSRLGYRGSVTLEAPAMLPEGLDVPALSETLAFLKEGFEGAGL
ncbi:MAG: sugar phosphate isomerase/epimerase [Clostridia bacterium]|nr:sugar phosphate isomerase/epimerase [Clostridia bacterium]MBR5743469.1 sugar phosphate isomerase/epimerase [Clostridia bacterium]